MGKSERRAVCIVWRVRRKNRAIGMLSSALFNEKSSLLACELVLRLAKLLPSCNSAFRLEGVLPSHEWVGTLDELLWRWERIDRLGGLQSGWGDLGRLGEWIWLN